jgi:hypothetical protein
MTPQRKLPEGFVAKAAIDMFPEAASIAVALIKLFGMTELERRATGDGNKGRRLWRSVSLSLACQHALRFFWLGSRSKSDDRMRSLSVSRFSHNSM